LGFKVLDLFSFLVSHSRSLCVCLRLHSVTLLLRGPPAPQVGRPSAPAWRPCLSSHPASGRGVCLTVCLSVCLSVCLCAKRCPFVPPFYRSSPSPSCSAATTTASTPRTRARERSQRKATCKLSETLTGSRGVRCWARGLANERTQRSREPSLPPRFGLHCLLFEVVDVDVDSERLVEKEESRPTKL